jgi:hypothetical protein
VSDEGLAILTLIVVLGGPLLFFEWLNRGKIKVCLDEYREIMCEYLTPEEYDEHLAEQARITAFVQKRRCSSELGRECV